MEHRGLVVEKDIVVVVVVVVGEIGEASWCWVGGNGRLGGIRRGAGTASGWKLRGKAIMTR